jgi:hypothetical protein
MNTVWILTEEFNDYNQHGEYFLAAFKEKPGVEKLMKFMSEREANHVQNGGGRIDTEFQWFNLREEELN